MNFVKIQTDILKMLDKQKGQILYEEDAENVYVSTDGRSMFVIPQCKWFLDTKKFNREPAPMKKVLKAVSDAKQGFMTDEVRVIPTATVRKFQNTTDIAWIDEKMLKEFKDATSYKMTNEISPVYFFDGETLLGMILPVRVMKKGTE